MKRFKKLLAVVLCLSLVLGLAAVAPSTADAKKKKFKKKYVTRKVYQKPEFMLPEDDCESDLFFIFKNKNSTVAKVSFDLTYYDKSGKVVEKESHEVFVASLAYLGSSCGDPEEQKSFAKYKITNYKIKNIKVKKIAKKKIKVKKLKKLETPGFYNMSVKNKSKKKAYLEVVKIFYKKKKPIGMWTTYQNIYKKRQKRKFEMQYYWTNSKGKKDKKVKVKTYYNYSKYFDESKYLK